MRRLLISIAALILLGCVAQVPDDDVVRAPRFPGPQAQTPGITNAKLNGVDPAHGGGGYGVVKDQSGIAWPPAIALFELGQPKPSFVQPSELDQKNQNAQPAEAGSPTVYPTRGQAAESTNSPTLYPPTGRFNTEPGNPSLYPRGPLAPRGFRGQ